MTGLHGYQIVHRPEGILVRVVPREDAGAALPERVRDAVAESLAEAGADVSVLVEVVSAIERDPGPAAKVKLVRSEV
jgi:hypothetical protein